MKKDMLITKINDLINELNKTSNSTADYFEKIKRKIQPLKIDDNEFIKILKGLHTSSKIKDSGGYNASQIKCWGDMWDVVDSMMDD